MRYLIFDHDANPAIDQCNLFVPRERFDMMLATGEIRRLTKRSAQYTQPRKKQAKRGDCQRDWAQVDTGRVWRAVGQTKVTNKGGGAAYGPGFPVRQLIPGACPLPLPVPPRDDDWED